jgi:hypothetical protein
MHDIARKLLAPRRGLLLGLRPLALPVQQSGVVDTAVPRQRRHALAQVGLTSRRDPLHGAPEVPRLLTRDHRSAQNVAARPRAEPRPQRQGHHLVEQRPRLPEPPLLAAHVGPDREPERLQLEITQATADVDRLVRHGLGCGEVALHNAEHALHPGHETVTDRFRLIFQPALGRTQPAHHAGNLAAADEDHPELDRGRRGGAGVSLLGMSRVGALVRGPRLLVMAESESGIGERIGPAPSTVPSASAAERSS